MPSSLGITVGVATNGRSVPIEWAHAMATQQYPSNTTVGYILMSGQEVGDSRERLCEEAIKQGSEFLWFVDDDTQPPYFAISQLFAAMRHYPNAVAIGGIYCLKTIPPSPLVYRGDGHGEFWDWSVGDVFEVTGIGTGCLLVRTSVLDKISRPWFKTTVEVPRCPIGGKIVLQTGQTDDLYFCSKVREAGYEIYAHGGVLCVHWDIEDRRAYYLPEDSLPYRNHAAGKKTAPLC